MMRMNKIHRMLILTVVFVLGLFTTATGVQAQTYLGSAENKIVKKTSAVNDYAGIYTEDEIASFEKKMAKMREEYDCNVVAFIIDKSDYYSSELSAPEEAVETYLNTNAHKSTVVLWLNVYRSNRSLYILGYGTAETKISNGEADSIAEDLQDYVIEQQSTYQADNTLYVEMMNTFIRQVDTQMSHPHFYWSWWFHLILACLLGGGVVLLLIRNSGGKVTVSGSTYINNGSSKVIGRRDIYTHTTYVRTRIEHNSSGGGGGGGGGHSSGGGRF